MNYSDINTSTFYKLKDNIPIASAYYDKIFRRISGPPRWLSSILFKVFEKVETSSGSFLCYNPMWNRTTEETITSYDIK